MTKKKKAKFIFCKDCLSYEQKGEDCGFCSFHGIDRKDDYYCSDGQPRIKVWDAVTWLEAHPEDIPLAKENLEARKHYDNDALRSLCAAISLKACADYKDASRGLYVDKQSPDRTMMDCHNFFNGEMFQMFINRITVDEAEDLIRSTPDGSLSSLWRQRA